MTSAMTHELRIKNSVNGSITFMSTALLIFQISIKSPTKQLIMMTVLVSLSMTYRRTMTDWKTLKNTDRTDRPSRVLRLRQNCMSKNIDNKKETNLAMLWWILFTSHSREVFKKPVTLAHIRETSAYKCLYSGHITLSTLLIK